MRASVMRTLASVALESPAGTSSSNLPRRLSGMRTFRWRYNLTAALDSHSSSASGFYFSCDCELWDVNARASAVPLPAGMSVLVR